MYYTTNKTRNYAPYFKSIVNEILADYPQAKQKHYKESSFPAVNVNETEEAFTIQIAAPGLKKEFFNIQTENYQLVVSYKEDKKEEKVNYTRREFTSQNFEKSFKLNDKINLEKIEAQYQDGILSVTLPKKEEKAAIESKNITVN